MPIEQKRLIALLDIIDSLRTRAKKLETFIERQNEILIHSRDPDELAELYISLRRATKEATSLTPEEFETFVHEREHFLFSAKKNAKSAEGARQFRARERARREDSTNQALLETIFPQPTHPPQPTLSLADILSELRQIQAQSSEPPTISDIANLFRKDKAISEGEATQQALFWSGELIKLGHATHGQFTGELILTDLGETG